MSDRLPPLTGLRAFDAAARHMSFAKAAAELNVTPAALSFQIKSLEGHLGAPLFHRLTRAVELSEAGRALAPGARDGFETLEAAWRAARRVLETNTLNVTAGPAFTAKWLAPRMYEFAQAHPEIELRIVAGLKLLDIERDEIDVAIRFGYGPDEGLYSRPMRPEWYTPVMLPNLAQQVSTPQDLLRLPLLRNSSDNFLQPACDWPAWFRAVGIVADPPIAASFSQPDHALDAALTGAGAVLTRQTFCGRYLREGRLVAPFRVAISTRAHFRVLCQKGAETRPNIRAFLDWISCEMQDADETPEGMVIIPVEEVPAP